MFFGGAYPDPIAFQVGAFGIHWYAIIIILGIFTGFWIVKSLANKADISEDLIWNFILYTIPAALIGGRLVFVLSHSSQFTSVVDTLKVWEGGISSHGVIGAGIIVAYVIVRSHKVSFFKFTDVLVPGIAIAQAIGRWGNYINQEAFGPPTEVWWAVPINMVYRPVEYIASTHFHPTWLYESLWNIVIFVTLYFLFKKLFNRPGLLTTLFFILYYVGRFALDFIRTDSVQAGLLTATQWVSVVVVIAALFFILRKKKLSTNQPS
ncbi:prolipoprotein diacylglyceryl transferase [Patescibacteria group bacterium]